MVHCNTCDSSRERGIWCREVGQRRRWSGTAVSCPWRDYILWCPVNWCPVNADRDSFNNVHIVGYVDFQCTMAEFCFVDTMDFCTFNAVQQRRTGDRDNSDLTAASRSRRHTTDRYVERFSFIERRCARYCWRYRDTWNANSSASKWPHR